MTPPLVPDALANLELALAKLRSAGLHYIVATAFYETLPGEAYFTSHFHCDKSTPPDHVFLDLQRELLVDWSNRNHKAKLTWEASSPSPQPLTPVPR